MQFFFFLPNLHLRIFSLQFSPVAVNNSLQQLPFSLLSKVACTQQFAGTCKCIRLRARRSARG